MTIQPIASLQMYWMPEIAGAVDAWWHGLRGHLLQHGIADVPNILSHPDDIHSVWHNPGLVLSQTCGGPLITELGETVRVIGTPSYDVPLTDGFRYRSAIIVHRENPAQSLGELRGGRVAINGRESYSGYHALCAVLSSIAKPGESFFNNVVVSGAHAASLEAVASGSADCAAIDAVCLHWFRDIRPEYFDAVRILTATPAVPGLPYITSGNASAARLESLRQGIEAAFADDRLASIRHALHLGGFVRTNASDYGPVAKAIETGRGFHL